MAKIKIDLNPTGPLTFERTVDIPTPSGKPQKVPFTFKHRMRDEMSELMEDYRLRAVQAQADAKQAEDAPELTQDELRERVMEAIGRDADAVMDVACGWGIDGYEFNRENLIKFLRIYPAAAMTIITDYRTGMVEGRLGN